MDKVTKTKWFKTSEVEPTQNDADQNGNVLGVTFSAKNKNENGKPDIVVDWHKIHYTQCTIKNGYYYWAYSPNFEI